jgi:hypothetical protein
MWWTPWSGRSTRQFQALCGKSNRQPTKPMGSDPAKADAAAAASSQRTGAQARTKSRPNQAATAAVIALAAVGERINILWENLVTRPSPHGNVVVEGTLAQGYAARVRRRWLGSEPLPQAPTAAQPPPLPAVSAPAQPSATDHAVVGSNQPGNCPGEAPPRLIPAPSFTSRHQETMNTLRWCRRPPPGQRPHWPSAGPRG